MKFPTLVENKKKFLQYFLNTFKLKNVKCKWFLEYLISNDYLLKNLYFVQSIKEFRKGIVISSKCSKGTGFQFHKEHVNTTDVERAFHDVRLHPDEKVYLQLNFKDAMQDKYYQQILSESHFTDDSIAGRKNIETIMNIEINLLKNQINDAIDKGDRRTFMILSKELNKKLLSKGKDRHEVD